MSTLRMALMLLIAMRLYILSIVHIGTLKYMVHSTLSEYTQMCGADCIKCYIEIE